MIWYDMNKSSLSICRATTKIATSSSKCSARFLCDLNACSYDFYLPPRCCLPVAYHIRDKFLQKTSLSLRRIWKRNFESNLLVSFSFIRDISSFSCNPRIYIRLVGCEEEGCVSNLNLQSRAGDTGRPKGINIWNRSVMCRRRDTVRAQVKESGNHCRHPAATLPAEFYEGIYMSAIFYGALNARSRSVPHCRGGRLWIKVRFKDFFLIPRHGG